VALVHTGRLPEAIVHFHQALRLQPDLVDAQYNLEIARNIVEQTTAQITSQPE
jgi:hypothetical protein